MNRNEKQGEKGPFLTKLLEQSRSAVERDLAKQKITHYSSQPTLSQLGNVSDSASKWSTTKANKLQRLLRRCHVTEVEFPARVN